MGKLYTKQFREQAMKLVTEQGYTPHRAAMQLGIPGTTLESWLKKIGYRRQPIVEPPLSDDSKVLSIQVRQLQKQVRQLEMEKEIPARRERRPTSPTSTWAIRVHHKAPQGVSREAHVQNPSRLTQRLLRLAESSTERETAARDEVDRADPRIARRQPRDLRQPADHRRPAGVRNGGVREHGCQIHA